MNGCSAVISWQTEGCLAFLMVNENGIGTGCGLALEELLCWLSWSSVPVMPVVFFFSSRRRHTRWTGDWSSDVCSSDLLTEQYDQQYGAPDQPVMAKAMKRYWKMSKQRPEIISELLSFRGLSPLSCGVWDTDDHLKTYDLFFLLTNTDFAVLSEADFMQEVKRRGLEERDFKKQLLYLKVLKYIPERLNLILGLNYDLGEYANMLHQMQELDSIFVREPRPVW